MKKLEVSAYTLVAQDFVMRWVRERLNTDRVQWTHMVITGGTPLADGHEMRFIKAGVRLSPDRRKPRTKDGFPAVCFEACGGYLDVRARVDFCPGDQAVPSALKVNCRGGHAVPWGCNGEIDGAYAVFEYNVPRVDL